MKCPHCLVEIFDKGAPTSIVKHPNHSWIVFYQICPACSRSIVELEGSDDRQAGGQLAALPKTLVFPKFATRAGCPTEVSPEFANDYKEAVLVIELSPKASAALARRCLQHLLNEKAGAAQRDLFDQIQYVLDNCRLPSHIADGLDAVRIIGNFAAHPMKSKSSGEILDVEPGEAEWNLDILEALFDYYFVQPAKTLAKKEALNNKVQQAGKPSAR